MDGQSKLILVLCMRQMCFQMNKTEMIIVTLLLMIWGSHATEPGTLLTNMSPDTGGPEGKDQLRFYGKKIKDM